MKMKELPNKLWMYFTNEPYRFSVNAHFGMCNSVSDEEYLKKIFYTRMHRSLNLENPQTFNEKLQWLKLHDRNPKYTIIVDKYLVRQYIAERIGEKYLIPLLGVWNDPAEIDFDALPQQFVLKCNHNSGLGLCVCQDKSKINIKKVTRKLRKALKQNYYFPGREWPYKDVPRKIIAEKYMKERSGNELTQDLRDYKLMCFNGKVKCSFVCSDRFSEKGLHVTFFDCDWNVMPFERYYPSLKEGLPKPKCYEKMVELAEILAKDIPFVRVDFYEVNGKIYFGELTLYPGSGMEKFTPEEWDYTLGKWLKLPKQPVL